MSKDFRGAMLQVVASSSVSYWNRVDKKQTYEWRAVKPVKTADTNCVDTDPKSAGS